MPGTANFDTREHRFANAAALTEALALEITGALQAERALPLATDLIAQFNPGVPDHDAALRALELIATKIAPALGWGPATEPARIAEPTAV